MCLTSKFFLPRRLGQGFNLLTLDYFQCSNCLVTLSPCFSASDLSPVQVPLIQTPLGQSDSGESDTDSSSSVSTPTATTGETTKEETTAERRPLHGMYYRCRVPWLGTEPPPFVFFLIKKEKRRFCLNRVKPLKLPQPVFLLYNLVNVVCSHQTGFLSGSIHSFIDKPMVITEL